MCVLKVMTGITFNCQYCPSFPRRFLVIFIVKLKWTSLCCSKPYISIITSILLFLCLYLNVVKDIKTTRFPFLEHESALRNQFCGFINVILSHAYSSLSSLSFKQFVLFHRGIHMYTYFNVCVSSE